jgi:sulfide dehydrogenase cytochrome subunit
MTDFREGRRPATLMGHVAKGFSDEDLKGMGEFFAAQTALGNAAGAQR